MVQGHASGRGYCAKCGGPVPQGALFCPHCGQRVRDNTASCSHCGASIRAGGRFCPSCGAEAGGGVALAAATGPVAQSEVEYMGFWIRLLAALVDAVLTGIAGSIIGRITGVPAIGSLASILYYVVLTGLRGQTIGKMALGIKVVNARGEVPGIGRAILREVVGKFVSAVALLLGYVWVAWHPQKRGWHDFIGGTYVIRKERRRV